MSTLASTPGARRLLGTSILARLPLPMLGIGLLVHAHGLTGSFAAAGVVTAVFAGALGLGGPLLARIADRRGQTVVLLGYAQMPEPTIRAGVRELARLGEVVA